MFRPFAGAPWISVAAILLASLPTTAAACRCVEPGVKQAYANASGVILGRILSAKTTSDGSATEYSVAIGESWKLAPDSPATILTGSTCAFEAEIGAAYLLFLSKGQSGNLETARCMGNLPAARAGKALRYLRRSTPGAGRHE
jgi:hypothetical protein